MGVAMVAYLVPISIEFADQFDGSSFIEAQFVMIVTIIIVQCLCIFTEYIFTNGA